MIEIDMAAVPSAHEVWGCTFGRQPTSVAYRMILKRPHIVYTVKKVHGK
jgi:hypothetical protein